MLYNVMLCNVMYLLHSSVASVLMVKIIEEVLNIHVFIILMLQWLFYCEFLGLL